MPEKFEPVKTEDTGDIDKFEFEPKGQPGLGEENYRLEHYLESQKDMIKDHLKAFKAVPMGRYTDPSIFHNDNEDAVNQAMKDYAREINEAIEASLPDLEQAIRNNETLYKKTMSINDVQKRISEIEAYYQVVADEWGPKLDKKIINIANTEIDDIVKNAEARAKEVEEEPEKPEKIFFENTKEGLTGETRRRREKEHGV